jgi:AcrR family transcriptional regulator
VAGAEIVVTGRVVLVKELAIAREGGKGQGAVTRAAIAASAQALFTENGYLGTSVRAIAASVGIDAALVIRYFGSKERLFLETMKFPSFLERALDGPQESLGERIVAAVFAGDVDARVSVFSALMRASDSDSIRDKMEQASERTFIEPLVRQLAGPDVELRARLIGAQVTGLLSALALGPDGKLGRTDRDRLITTYGRAVQALVDPPP